MPEFGRLRRRMRLRVGVVLGVVALLIVQGGSALAAGGGTPSAVLPDQGNYVSSQRLPVPAPAPTSYGYPVDDVNSGDQPQWSGVPLMLSNRNMVAYLPATNATCGGAATNQVCVDVGQIVAYKPGYFAGIAWRYDLPKGAVSSQLVWTGSAIAFVETLQANSPSDASLRFVRLAYNGKALSDSALPLPKQLVGQFGRIVDLTLAPAPNGAVLSLGVAGIGSEVEKLTVAGALVWSRPAQGVVWSGGPVTLVSTQGNTYEALATSTGRVLWSTSERAYTAAIDGGVAVFAMPLSTSPNVTDFIARSSVTGHVLWKRPLADVVQEPRATFPQHLVFGHNTLIVCSSTGAANRKPRQTASCMEYLLSTGRLEQSIQVPNAAAESVVNPIASSRRYLLVQVMESPWADCSPDLPVWTCRPSNTITEAIPWAGKGPVKEAEGGSDQQLTYDVGTTPVTVTTSTSSWRW